MTTRELKNKTESKISNLIDVLELLGKDITEAVKLSFAVLKANDYVEICEIEMQASEIIGNDLYLNDMIDCELETENN